ncbi:MAG TPA: amino acid adenylation domain-containing protein [Sandaracinaceae bacterium LLY-WYZ-13_1]|nr:amino acid adenylation domain-containing protein [Sandaracinaceae bacterium LLY-WYZ-13_1]
MTTTRTLRSGFAASAERHADREALTVGDETLTYRELDVRARRVAATLDRHAPDGEGRLTAVFGHRHPTAFAGVLGALTRGHGYVPLNPAFPTERCRSMMTRARCRSVVVDPTAIDQLDELLEGVDEPRVVLAPDADDVSELAARHPSHRFLGAGDLAPADACEPRQADPDDLAYVLFTSGSTGRPKGVMVAHRNVVPFVDFMVERYGITEADRLSNTFDLTFDLSVFDMFCAWEKGACLCVPTAQQKMFPGKYVKKQALTVWFSVPSTGVLMSRLKMLKPGSYPTLRWALFCGEALPVEIVEKFAEAAPNATVENLYGPTELTIACTLYRWDPARSPGEAEMGVTPIGAPYPDMEVRICDEALHEVPRGEAGELLMTGPQMTPGYWEDPEKTAKAFVVPPGEGRTFYRTGDRVRWPEGGPMIYLGRVDNQIKIQGYRVELGEIEAVLRDVSGAEAAIALGWPKTASGADGVVGFVGAPDADADAVLEAARAKLPGYMQPSAVHLVERFPLNPNGKIDRKALMARLEEG